MSYPIFCSLLISSGVPSLNLSLKNSLRGMGVWISQVLNGVVTCLTVLIYTLLVTKRVPRNINSMLLLSDSFGVPENDRLNISIHSLEEVLNTSEKVIEFCRAHNMDKKHSFYAGLSIEEMAGNIGIRLISMISKRMEYQFVLGLNVLSVWV